MKQTLSDGTIQYRKAWIDMHTEKMYAYGEDTVNISSRVKGDIWYYDCVEKRPNKDGYYESHWVHNVEETA
tara:strand:- start:148 stop:360 length:213 start_codon:yes stop_codon:yes gene_type:complete